MFFRKKIPTLKLLVVSPHADLAEFHRKTKDLPIIIITDTVGGSPYLIDTDIQVEK